MNEQEVHGTGDNYTTFHEIPHDCLRPSQEEDLGLFLVSDDEKADDGYAWDYRAIKKWRMCLADWDNLFSYNLRKPWPAHFRSQVTQGEELEGVVLVCRPFTTLTYKFDCKR